MLSNKKEGMIGIHQHMQESHEYYIKQKSQTQKYTYIIIPFMWSSKTDRLSRW